MEKRQVFSPGPEHFIKQRIQTCDCCISRNTAPVKSAQLLIITSSATIVLLCIDYMCIEPYNGGHEKFFVTTNNFTRYAQTIRNRNQSANTSAKAILQNIFPLQLSFEIHCDQGANFESKVTRKMCYAAGINKTRTTLYHPI